MKIEIIRLYQTPIDDPKQTEGVLYLIDKNKIIFECKTLELPWLNNNRRVSCIPTGKYKAVKHVSPKFGNCLWIKDVPNRSEILIHPANYVRQLLGCIALGNKHIDMNRDGLMDVADSKTTVNKLLNLIEGKEIEVEIIWR